MDMNWVASSILLLGSVLGLMALGVHVALAFLITDLIGAYIFMGGSAGFAQLLSNGVNTVTSFTLLPVPLFLLMGELFFHTGLAVRVFDALDKCLGGVPGRLALIVVGGGTIFAALSGSSMANTAMLGSTMVPEMTKRGYKPLLSVGTIMGTGSLAILIPPSALAVLLGSLARVDIGALLLACIIPGLLLAACYVALVLAVVGIDPAAAPTYAVPKVSLSAKLSAIAVNVLPMGFVVFLVIGLMLLGWATPSESAAFGVGGVVVLALIYRRLTRAVLVASLRGTLKITAMLLLIIIGSATFSQILAFSGASSGLIGWATGLQMSDWVALLVMYGLLLLLGCFVDQLSIIMLTVPIFYPLAASYGMHPIWFSVIIMMALEIGFITPPFGLNLYVMKGVVPPEITFAQICRAVVPFVLCAILVSVLVMIFPPLALWLPAGVGNAP